MWQPPRQNLPTSRSEETRSVIAPGNEGIAASFPASAHSEALPDRSLDVAKSQGRRHQSAGNLC